MIYNPKLPVLLFVSVAIIILVVGEPQTPKSSNPTGLLQSLLRKWQILFDRTQWISKSDQTEGDSSARAANLLSSEKTTLVGSMVPLDENLVVPQFLSVGRQQIGGCACVADMVDGAGLCSTTCLTAETLCGDRICTRTTILTAFSSDNDPNFPREIKNIDERACESLEVSCILSSALATASAIASSSSAAAVITTAAANVALSAGIAVGAAALGVAAAKSKKNHETYEDQYYETEDHHYDEYYSSNSYAKRQGRKAVDTVVNHGSEIDSSSTVEIPDGFENLIVPEIAGSIAEVSNFERQAGCNCVVPPAYGFNGQCSTTCYSYQQLCGGQTCTITTFFSAFYFNNILCQHTTTNVKDCETLDGVCSLSTSFYPVVQTRSPLASYAIAAGAVTAGLAAGNIALVATNEQPPNCQQPQPPTQPAQQQLQQQPPQQQLENQTPNNHQPIPVDGTDCPDDGCNDNSVRFPDGNCYPIFSGCNNTNFWVTFDNTTSQDGCGMQGKCTPRLCDDRRVFVGRTGLCHDINDPIECPGGRRLYYTAFGDSICDCPIGQYPFPNTQDNCVALFSQGPCPGGQVVTLSQGGRLFCTPGECQSPVSSTESLVPSEKGQCQAIGSRGTCSSAASQWLGYDIFKRQLQCTNVTDPSSPYSSFLRERRLAKKISTNLPQVERNQWKNDVPIETVHQNLLIKTNDTNNRRQSTLGLFQVPSSISDSLLQPCRTGARRGFNQKCTNPLVSNSNRRPPLPPVRPNFSCPSNTFLQAGGQCVNDRPSVSCGPSFQFNSLTGQCRPRF